MKEVDEIIERYQSEYDGEGSENVYVVKFDKVDYISEYSFITDSSAFDKNYASTDYTVDNGNVTMVTYRKGDHKVSFLLNYNNFSVTVKLNGVSEPVVLDAYDCLNNNITCNWTGVIEKD
jgi:hypothetical protein